MDRLLLRARSLPQLSALSDHQLRALLAQSDPQAEGVSPNVILFQHGESLSCWYLLLSGQIQLYLDHSAAAADHCPHSFSPITPLKTIGPGTFFGELRNCADASHCCSAKVVKAADFVRIDHSHFMAFYNKWAEQLQTCIMPMEDLVAEAEQNVPNRTVTGGQKKLALEWTPKESEGQKTTQKRRVPEEKGRRERHSLKKPTAEKLLFKLCFDHSTIDYQISHAASQLKEALSGTDFGPISGADLCVRLRALCAQWLPDFRQPFSALMLQGICQTLLDRFLLVHVRTDRPLFRDSPASFYRWAPPSSRRSAPFPPAHCLSLSSSLLLLCLFSADSLFQQILQKESEKRTPEELGLVLGELSQIRAFGHFSRTMKQGLARIITCECHEHAGTVIFREGDPGQSWLVVLRGTLEVKSSGKRHSLLHEGDDFGKLALLNNCEVNGNNHQMKQQKRTTNSNNSSSKSQRQSTVITAEDGCQLLRVDATKFGRLLNEMETNTVRLKEYLGCEDSETERTLDVLVLQRDAGGRHSLIAGLPSKILEYILETRIDHMAETESQIDPRPPVDVQPAAGDSLFLDVLLSLPLWMPSNEVCNILKLYYCFGISNSLEQNEQSLCHPTTKWTRTTSTATKRRTVTFVMAWQMTVGHRFFLDSVANAFVEELFSCVLEDARTAEDPTEESEFGGMMRQMESLMEKREEFMRQLSRLPRVVLDEGMYNERAPAPDPVLPSDLCIQCVHLTNDTDHSKRSVTLQLRMDKCSAEISQMAMNAFQTQQGDNQQQKEENALAENGDETTLEEGGQLVLVEMRSGGREAAATRQFEPRECSVPTMLMQMNADQLFVAYRKELHKLSLLLVPAPPPSLASFHSLCLQLSPMRIAKAMALHHFKLLAATSASELLVQIVGREHFPPALAPSNLDLMLRRFHLVQSWASTEVLLAPPADRLTILQTLIELAQLALQQKDLLSLFAITLGLSHLPVARLHSVWAQLPDMCRNQHLRSQFLLAPARNHRNYRLLAQRLRPPFVPFVPVMVKELSFVHDGRNSRFADGLINFEKMHLIAKVLRHFRWAKGEEQWPRGRAEGSPFENAMAQLTMGQTWTDEALIRNLHAVDDQRHLMRLSLAILPQQQQEVLHHAPPPPFHQLRHNFSSVTDNRCQGDNGHMTFSRRNNGMG